ncbi:MAG TPA: hypothetical protein VF297_24380 [Pyrinomonadaceae bacterium]
MKICKDVEEWIEENIEQEIQKQEERCEDWPWPLDWFCSLVTFIVRILVTIVRKIVRVVCEVIVFVVNVVAAILNVVFALPLIGPIVKAIIRIVATAISYVVGLLDGLARLIGIRITKHLRVHVLLLCEGVIPLAYEAHLTPIMRETERILYDRAQIRVHTTFHDPIRNPPEDALRLGTEVDLILDEAWLKGTWHQMNTVKLFESNLWSLIGIGHPLVVYVVREVGYDGPGTVIGASGGPFVDWIAVERDSVVQRVVGNPATGMPTQPLSPFPPTVATTSPTTPVPNPGYSKFLIAHEMCHALGLLGHANSRGTDLMVPGTIKGDALSPFQVGIIRNSAHVTFL